MKLGRYIIMGVVFLIIQILACEFLGILPLIYIAVLPLFVILLPKDLNPYALLLIAFVIGLVADTIVDGVLGLNATALLCVAFFKNSSVNIAMGYEKSDNLQEINSLSMGRRSFIILTVLSYTIFFLLYCLLDGVGSSRFFHILWRIILNAVLNTFIAVEIERLISKRILVR